MQGDMALEKSPEQALHLTPPHSTFTRSLAKDTKGLFTKRVGNAKWVGIARMLEYKI